jgi:hypothetical protein
VGDSDGRAGEYVTWNPIFQVDTDTVGAPSRADIASLDTGGTHGGPTITVQTVVPHVFTVGSEVTIIGLTGDYAVINGAYPIFDIPDSSHFRFSLDTNLPSRDVAEGVALSPSAAYIRFVPHDTLLDSISEHATLYVEPWDYNTIRAVWGSDPTLDDRAVKDVDNGRDPLVVLTRSGFGYPSTPIDGVPVLWAPYANYVPSLDRPRTVQYTETLSANPANDWNRPPLTVQSLYDRNLTPGHWYYYSVFFYLGKYDDLTGGFIDQVWVRGATMDALTPVNHHHSERFYDLIPEYYQSTDQEFLAGTGRRGVLERFLQVIGFEVDYTRTLADGIEHVYDIDTTHDDLMHSLGVFNFGVPAEDGLGDIRYRSLLATVSRLYEERGSASGLRRMTAAATKYRCKVLEGPNILNLADDAEFSSGTGSWGNPVPEYAVELSGMEWLGRNIASFNAVSMASIPLLTTSETASSLVLRRNAMEVGALVIPGGFDQHGVNFDSPIPFDGEAAFAVTGEDVPFDAAVTFDYPVDFDGAGTVSDAVMLTCGLGGGFQTGRRHEEVAVQFFPHLQGIRCEPGVGYTFSGYSVLKQTDVPLVGKAAVGILWFNDDADGFFDFTQDFIKKDESVGVDEATSTDPDQPGPFQRYFIDGLAPTSTQGQPFVFAVPYWIFVDSQPRYISACMFNQEVNSAKDAVLPAVKYLRLGMPQETLGSQYVLGSL